MKKPNLFDYATSELSQDAFIAWLITWADEQYAEIDKHLNQCAASFVRELIGESEDYAIGKVEAGRQWNNIDIWATVNDEFFVVIEDKKGTKERSGQLQTYAEVAKGHYGNTHMKVVLVYFRMEEQGDYSNVEEAGYKNFRREKMLKILDNYYQDTSPKERNDILVDYYFNLKELDAETNSFKTAPLSQWKWHAWKGFYSFLQNVLMDGKWRYVSSKAGGFLGFWWNFHYINIDGKEFEFYLQLEQEKLVFKIYPYEAEEREIIRDLYRQALYQKAEEKGIEVHQFGRLGKWMGVAKLANEYRIADENGMIELDATVNHLKEMERLLEEAEKELRKAHHFN